ncbi:MAG: ABC-F family ATP-binding cassette domain-containing protein [Clostridiales bacterium]|nr:ABC-F family ATP-binding cassette domain-containing protein [Clostridiales bacterium]
MLLEISDGTVSRQGSTILSHINFEIHGTEKIAVVGENGAGKSTLLHLIAGDLELDRDDRSLSSGIRSSRRVTVGMLNQQAIGDGNRRVEEILMEGIPGEDIYDRERFRYETEYNRMFTGFGFSREDKGKYLREFSGGQQTRIAMIHLLLSKPDILLLDEPTNHLDSSAVEWLEEYLRNYEKAVVFVSHDRYFTDQVAEVVYEVSGGKLTRYPGNYTNYRQEKEKRLQLQWKKYEQQQEEIQRLNELVERFRNKPRKAAFARSRKKILERMEKVERPDRECRRMIPQVQPARFGSKWVWEAEHMKVGYDHVLQELSLRIRRGQKIAILGENGVGKSTLLKTAAGKIPVLDGKMQMGEGIDLVYFDQNTAEWEEESSVLDFFRKHYPVLTEKEARTILASYRFPGADAGKKVSDLSGGEKMRLMLAVLLQEGPNFLLLDEPTNHMDIPSREMLEEVLMNYQGTILFVSHDRYFIRQVAESLLVLEKNGDILYYPFGYDHYCKRKNRGKSGENLTAVRAAEEEALISGLKAVPKAERQMGPVLSEEEEYRDWCLRLAEEQLFKEGEKRREAEEKWERARCQEPYWVSESFQSEADGQYQNAQVKWEQACLSWYDEWSSFHFFMDEKKEDIYE